MTHKTAIMATILRQRAQALKANPIPLLTKSNIKKRWKLESFQTIKRVLEKHTVLSVNPDTGERPLFKLTDILRVEGVVDPVGAWTMGSEQDRELLKAPLLTPDEHRAGTNRLVPQHLETVRRRARSGAHAGIKIGKQWRFRQLPNDDHDDCADA